MSKPLAELIPAGLLPELAVFEQFEADHNSGKLVQGGNHDRPLLLGVVNVCDRAGEEKRLLVSILVDTTAPVTDRHKFLVHTCDGVQTVAWETAMVFTGQQAGDETTRLWLHRPSGNPGIPLNADILVRMGHDIYKGSLGDSETQVGPSLIRCIPPLQAMVHEAIAAA